MGWGGGEYNDNETGKFRIQFGELHEIFVRAQALKIEMSQIIV